MKHDMHYRDCSACEVEDEPNLFIKTVDTGLLIALFIVGGLLLALAA